MTGNARNILVVAHARRPDTVLAARRVIAAVAAGGATAVLPPDDDELRAELGEVGRLAILGAEVAVTELELAVVLGGDGTILRAAELVRTGTAPILGINMGHVGFLAEIEADVIDDAMRRVLAGDYAVEERMTLDVEVRGDAGELIYETWALNEATVEKASRERMLEVV
ncbi:MAG TPA: NAD(+)/NADH kinase, partial [Microbacterium sp.]|nr:NAD(+)/NADH kinase [Microbacterium sp.]